MLSQSVLPFRASSSPHTHVDDEVCPWCEQTIPPDKLEEISGKIALREREQSLAITSKLQQQYESEKAEAAATAQANIDLERRQSVEREAAAREEGRQAAAAVAADQLAASEEARQALQTKIDQTETANAGLQSRVQSMRREYETALATLKSEATAREADIRTDAQRAAETAMAEKLAESERARVAAVTVLQEKIAEAEGMKSAAEAKNAELQEQLTATQKAGETEKAQLKEEAAAEVIRAREEATAAALQLTADKVTASEHAASQAFAKAEEAEGRLATLADQHALAMEQNLASQREIMEKAKDDAVNAEKARAFDENQKLSNKVNELQRALEKKSNDELGEGAEVDLFESLKKEFPDDEITRIGKGIQGADILHVVALNGKKCGTIIYDSKNHGQFRSEHVTKLRSDQLAAKAEHAILSTRKFPEKTSQLHQRDGVLLANPARVVAVVMLIRQHLIQTHRLRMSNAERESKTAALYDFITGDRCAQFLARVDNSAEELLALQVKEMKFHKAAWEKEGEIIKRIQKTQADLTNEISGIIGTAAEPGPAPEEIEI